MRDLLFVGLFALFLTNTHAADINDLTYDATGDTVIITDCAKDAAGDLVIPETIEGKPVTSIGGEAFRDCTSLTSITFGKNSKLTSIGEQAFRKCESLKSITIPDSVTSIGNMAFSGCRGLTSITIPDSVTSIEGGAFSSCSYLTSIKIPDSVTSIGPWAFRDCRSLTSITFEENSKLTSIGAYAFLRCTSVTSIKIPNSVINIEANAFFECERLTYLKIGDKVNCIGRSAFAYCNSLAWVTLGRGLINIKSRAFEYCRRLKSITIPENVTMIGDRAFYGASLNSITFESNTAPIIESSALDRSNMILYVPQGAIGYDSLRFWERHTIEWIKPKFEHVDCSIVKIKGNEKKRLTFPIENGKKYFIQSSYDLSKWDYILGGISEPNNIAEDLKVVFDEQQKKKALVPTEDIGKDWIQLNYDDSNWFDVESVSADGSLAGGGVGFGSSRTDPFDPYIALDLEEQMHDTNASVYIRIPFIIDELSEIKSLILSARTDDGFVAWINGEKVLSFNAPDVPHWNSEATASNPDRIATNLEDFSLDNYIDKLIVGENILAVQAMNRGKGGSDFLFSCFLRVPKKKFSIEYPLINPTNQNQLRSQFYRVISQ